MQIDLKLLKHQREFLFHKKPFGGLVAGFGAGKSYIATIKTILFNIQNPGINSAYYLPTYGLVKDICFDKFPDILMNTFGFKPSEFQLNKSTKEILLFNYNNKIMFRNMMEPETIVGYETGFSLIDECDILSEDKMDIVFNKILGRNRKHLVTGGQNVLDMVGTPEGFKFFYKKFVEEKKDNQILIRAKTTDNKHLPETFIEQLESQYDKNLLKQYMNGEFVNINGNNVYNVFDRFNMDSKEEIIPGETLHIGQDFNVEGCCSCVYVERGSKIILVEEFVSNNTFEIVENIKDRYPNNKNIIMYPDASGKNSSSNSSQSDVGILNSAGFKIIAPTRNPKIVDRVNAVNSLMRTGNFLINVSKCPQTVKGLEQQVYKNGSPEKFNGPATIDDWLDAMGYYIANKYKINKPRMKKFSLI